MVVVSSAKFENTEIIQLFCKSLNLKLLLAKSSDPDKTNCAQKVKKLFHALQQPEFRKNQANISENGLQEPVYRLASVEQQHISESIVEVRPSPKVRPKIAFLFTGQGSQYGGMARSLYETSTVFRTAFDQCSALLLDELPVSLKDVIWGNSTILLNESLYSQTGIFCIEYALLQLWKSFGIEPDFVLGPSAGAFCASVAAGILSFEDALKLVTGRGKAIQTLPIGGMTSVKATVPMVQKLIDSCFDGVDDSAQWLDIAVINSPDDIVVAGRPESLKTFETLCYDSGIKSLRLAASQAFHSREIEGIREEYGKVLDTVTNQEPKCGYISGVTGKCLKADEFDSAYWQSHARDPVDFPAAMEELYELGARVFIEIGPQPTLLTVGRHNLGQIRAEKCTWISSLKRTESEWSTVFSNFKDLHLAGIDLCFETSS